MNKFINFINGDEIILPSWDEIISTGGLRKNFEIRMLDYKEWYNEKAYNEKIIYDFLSTLQQ